MDPGLHGNRDDAENGALCGAKIRRQVDGVTEPMTFARRHFLARRHPGRYREPGSICPSAENVVALGAIVASRNGSSGQARR